jgi:hypothetical protein
MRAIETDFSMGFCDIQGCVSPLVSNGGKLYYLREIIHFFLNGRCPENHQICLELLWFIPLNLCAKPSAFDPTRMTIEEPPGWNRYFPGGYDQNADRVFYFDEGPRATTKLISKAYPKAQKSQTT